MLRHWHKKSDARLSSLLVTSPGIKSSHADSWFCLIYVTTWLADVLAAPRSQSPDSSWDATIPSSHTSAFRMFRWPSMSSGSVKIADGSCCPVIVTSRIGASILTWQRLSKSIFLESRKTTAKPCFCSCSRPSTISRRIERTIGWGIILCS